MGLHYSLVNYIVDHARLPNCAVPADAYLSEFCFYPPISHIVAAFPGALVGSPFLGMHLLTVAGTYVCYVAFFSTLQSEDDAATIALLAWFVVFSLALVAKPFFLGAEVRGNYFFAQLIGNSFLLAFIATQAKPRLILTLLAIFMLPWVYALTAVQLAAITIVWLVLERVPLFKLASFTALAGGLIYFHPKFQQSILLGSGADAAISTGYIAPFAILPLIAALAVCAGVLAWSQWQGKLGLLNGNRLIAVAAGLAGAAAMQAAAYHLLHSGSSYIVRKHAFDVGTLLAGCIFVLLLGRLPANWIVIHPRRAAVWPAIVCAAIISTAIVIAPVRGSSTANMIAAEKAVRADPRAVFSMRKGTDRFALEMGLNHRDKDDAFLDNTR